jgi:hypothetical protein
MTSKFSTRVRIKGKNAVVQRTADNHADTRVAIREVAEEALRLRRANEVANKSVRQGYLRRKKTDA